MSNTSKVSESIYDGALERATELAFAIWDKSPADIGHAANAAVFQTVGEKDLDAMSYAEKKSLVADVSSALAEAGGDSEAALRTTDSDFGRE